MSLEDRFRAAMAAKVKKKTQLSVLLLVLCVYMHFFWFLWSYIVTNVSNCETLAGKMLGKMELQPSLSRTTSCRKSVPISQLLN